MAKKSDEKNEEKGLGRYDLFEHITQKTGLKREETAFGTSTVSEGEKLLVSHEIMLEGIDFSLVYFPLRHLGYKLVVRTLAGIFASGGRPAGLRFSVGMSSRFGKAEAEDLIEGIKPAAKKYGVEIRHFDFISSLTGLTLSCTAWGYRKESGEVKPSPAVNDLICVTGDLGAAFTGLQVLERERRIFQGGAGAQPDLSDYEYTIGRQLKPELRVDLISELDSKGIKPSVMTVVREGLATELIGLCRENNLGCRLYYDKIPIDQATHRNASEMNYDPVTAAMNGGDDYEFLMLIPIDQVKSVNEMAGLVMIGYLTDPSEGSTLVTPDDSLVELRAQGWKLP
ncbi:MAG: AIR synthase related protein [Bacteroidales bacterium]